MGDFNWIEVTNEIKEGEYLLANFDPSSKDFGRIVYEEIDMDRESNKGFYTYGFYGFEITHYFDVNQIQKPTEMATFGGWINSNEK